MSTLLDDQDVDRKPSAEAAALAAAGNLAASIPGATTEPIQLPALAAQMTDVQPVASTSQVTLDLYGQPVPDAAAAAAVEDSDMEDSATEDEQLPQGTDGINSRDDDEETEEDEDSSDEETLRAVQKRQGQARRMEAVQGLYPGEQVLPDEEFGTKTVAEIYAMLEANVINLSPDYQRDVVWPENQAAGLVESLLRNMHVPEILFNTYTPVPEDLWYTAVKAKSVIRPEGSVPLPAGFDETWSADEIETNPKLAAALARGDLVPRDVWNCADGKQRMSSIKHFMRGEFQITGEDGTRYTYASLPPQARKVLDSKRLRYGFYRDLSDAQEREIFRRVQLGKALDKGEIMNAITSPYADWVQKIKDDLFSQRPDRLARSLKPRLLTGARGIALKAAYAISNNLLCPISEIKFEGDAIRSRKMAADEPPPRHKQLDVDVALKRFVELTQVPPLEGEDRWPSTEKYRKLRENNVPVPHRVWRLRPKDVKGHEHKKIDAVALAPVELNLLPAVVHHFRDLSNGDLLEVVFRLRKHLHETFPGEMKDNSKLYNAVKDWVAEFEPSSLKHRYKDDGTLRKKGESSTPVNARPPKRRLPREGPEHTPVPANKRAALDLTESDDAAPPSRDRDRRDGRAEKSSSQARQSDTQGSENGTQKPQTTSSASRHPPRPISTSSTSNGSKAAPAPPRQPPPRPPPPPQPAPAQATNATNSTGGLSWKQAKFARNFTPGPPNGGASISQAQRSAIHSLPSSKRMTGPLEFDKRGRPILTHRESSVQPGMAENDAQAAFYDQAADDMQRIMAQKRQYANGAGGASWGGSMNGRSPLGGGYADPYIGLPPTPTSADLRDQQLQAIIASKQQAQTHSAAPYSRPSSAFNSNPGGGGGGFRQYGSDSSGPRFPPVDSGWPRAPTSGSNGYQPEGDAPMSGGHSPYQRPAERTQYPGPPAAGQASDPRERW